MSLPRLCTRVARLEHDARRVVWYADVGASLVRCMAEAGTAVGLAPAAVQGLCTALEQTLHAFSPYVPACCSTDVLTCSADVQAVEAFTSRVGTAMLTMLDTQVTDPSTRYRLRETLYQAGSREVMARAGITARMIEETTDAELDARIAALTGQRGFSICLREALEAERARRQTARAQESLA